MTRVIIPGSAIKSEMDLHRFLARELDFGPYYGKNLDALWDRLTTDVERPVEIIWAEAGSSRESLGADLFERISMVIRRAAEMDLKSVHSDRLTFEIRE